VDKLPIIIIKIKITFYRVSFPWKSIWKFKVPTRVTFFVIDCSLGRILT